MAMEDNTVLVYKCDNYYQPTSESGIIYNDATLNIDWMLSEDEIILSDKDRTLKSITEFKY